jgi:GNAT superfamily N-acetyltransferase
MKRQLEIASPDDAAEVASLRRAAAEHLTGRHGQGHWSSGGTEAGALRDIRTSRVLVLRSRARIVATLRLAKKKPWAIDPTYFTRCASPIYLTNMAVAPSEQGRGVGRRCVEEAVTAARQWSGDAMRLDAYDAPAGAGPFYAKCGFREVGRVVYRKTPLVYYELLLRIQVLR